MAYPVSANFTAALTSAQILTAVQASILSGGQPIPGYTNLPVETATITCARTQAQRTTLSVTLDPSTAANLIPADLTSPLAPNGNEIAISIGIRYPDGSQELVPCGVFPIQTVTVTDNGTDLTLAVQCADRSWSISRRPLLAPYTIPAGTTLDQALHALLSANTSGMPPFTYNIAPTTAIAPVNTYREGQDPWQAALDLASGAGMECFFDRYGNIAARPLPGPGTIAPTWNASELTQGGVLALARVLTANQVSNDFVVMSQSSNVTPPVRAEASDTNPASPTWTGSRYGDIVTYLSSSTIADAAGAEAAAQSQLYQSLGQIDTLTATILPNPAVDIDDIFTVTRTRANLTGAQWVVDGYTLPVGTSAEMTVNLRRVIQ